jgi:hypothetical protein
MLDRHRERERPWFVQMFDVAFSRRMCCSRVESVSTKPRSPVLVDRLADEAARVSAAADPCPVAAREEPHARPAELWRHRERLALADGDVGAECAGGLEQGERVGLVRDRDQQSAPFVQRAKGGADRSTQLRRSWGSRRRARRVVARAPRRAVEVGRAASAVGASMRDTSFVPVPTFCT